jgi:hypothetical protein
MFHLALALIIIPLTYIKIVKDCIDEVIGQYKTEDHENMFDIKFSIDDQLFWETLKIMLRDLSMYTSLYQD